MPVNEQLLNRVREALEDLPEVAEKRMFGGICFMVNDKLCICVRNTEILCRIGLETYEDECEKNGVELMVLGKRVMKGYVLISPEAMQAAKDFNYWIDISLVYNKVAKASKRR
ncbi:TfoX/Sxy family protein [Mucilaginibacter gynuensis]|uniref:TfoX/Sxy family protein n=1 Tax=Mucilaginibacter gynuensis TaxID=1302236 RepID=A0ABP8G2D9_9SPHI